MLANILLNGKKQKKIYCGVDSRSCKLKDKLDFIDQICEETVLVLEL